MPSPSERKATHRFALGSLDRLSLAVPILMIASCTTAPVVVQAEPLVLRTDRDSITIGTAEHPFARVGVKLGEPLVLQALFAHDGRGVLRADDQDTTNAHSEQRPLMIAHADVNGADFWYRRPGGGADLKRHGVQMGTDGLDATIDARLEWREGRDSELLMTEHRVMRFEAIGDLRTVDFDIQLSATGTPALLGDAKDGFFAIALAAPFERFVDGATGRAFSPEREETRSAPLWGTRARWMCFVAQEPAATDKDTDTDSGTNTPAQPNDLIVAIFDHPENLRHPTRWHMRPYGLSAANPFGVSAFDSEARRQSGGTRIEPYETLRLRYRVVLLTGKTDLNRIENLWLEFAGIDKAEALQLRRGSWHAAPEARIQ